MTITGSEDENCYRFIQLSGGHYCAYVKKIENSSHVSYIDMIFLPLQFTSKNDEKIGEAFTSNWLRNVPRNKNVIFVLVNQEIDF